MRAYATGPRVARRAECRSGDFAEVCEAAAGLLVAGPVVSRAAGSRLRRRPRRDQQCDHVPAPKHDLAAACGFLGVDHKRVTPRRPAIV